ncbi:hypothetical protein WJX75_003329 [Coccomyxa subellipsoidea]|uniref:LisH domain-containing protein n=1 Tax=Coccomyxa subellipsoidea TaxID=248742 RepID=A0ABR2YT17_9CHLO
MIDARRSVGASELAVVVLQYLADLKFTKTAKSFKREAKKLLEGVGQVPRGLKPLAEIVSEYVALKEANTLRLQLLAGNPALSDVFQVIETHAAACQPAPLLNPAAQCAEATPAALGERRKRRRSSATGAGQSQGGAEAAEAPQEGFYAEMVDPGVSDNKEAFDGAQPGFSAAGVSPRKTLRKRAPRKRKKAAAASEAATQLDPAGDGFGVSMMDLLNLPINERALETLLAGEWQGRFAEGLASCINGRLGPQQQQELEQLAAQDTTAGLPVYDEVEMNTWMESLTGDPGMAALLEPIVAPSQEVQDDNQLGEVHQDIPDDMRLDDDGHGPAEQLAAPATIPEPDQAPQHAQQEKACACQEPDQAPEAARELPPPAPVQATSSAPAAPAAPKARRRLSLEPTAFTSGGPSHVPAADQPASMQPQAGVSQPQPQEVRRETTGAVSAAPDAAAALPVRDELFAELPERLPAVQRLARDNPDSRKPRRLSADAMATPKLSAFLSNPMSTLDGFPGHILAAKTTAAAQPPAAAQLPLPSVQPAAAGRSQVVPVAAQITQADGKEQIDEAAAAQQLASEDQSLGFLSGAISTLDGFPGDNFRGPTGGPVTSRESARQPQRGAWKAAGGNPSADMSTAQKAQRDKSGSAEMGSAAPQLTSRDRSIGFFSDPISTLDGFPRDILRETTGGLSVFRAAAQAYAALAAPTFSNLSFLDAMPTLDGFSVGGSPASQRGASPEEASGSRAAHALSPIPLRLAADGRLSNGQGAFTRHSPAAASGPSTCGQQETGGKSSALSSVFGGGASAETLDAFMRSLKY